MKHSFDIEFEPPITSFVTTALVPVDRFSRRPLRAGVSALPWDIEKDRALPYRMIRSRSGYLVLLDQPFGQSYLFRVDASTAGYISPIDVSVTPSADNRKQLVLLDRAAGFSFEPEATLVRGTIANAETAPGIRPGLANAQVALAGERFQTTTDQRGSFALGVELPAPPAGEPAAPVDVELSVTHPDHETRLFSVTLEPRRTHIFTEPIEIDGTNEPAFVG